MKIRLYKKGDERGILKLDSLLETHHGIEEIKKIGFGNIRDLIRLGNQLLLWLKIKKIIATFAIIPIDYTT